GNIAKVALGVNHVEETIERMGQIEKCEVYPFPKECDRPLFVDTGMSVEIKEP
ncbi:hypothetical protein Ancab_017846, partial [Ancistrocladus abbreviatus]